LPEAEPVALRGLQDLAGFGPPPPPPVREDGPEVSR
jgi:hypothetical protein